MDEKLWKASLKQAMALATQDKGQFFDNVFQVVKDAYEEGYESGHDDGYSAGWQTAKAQVKEYGSGAGGVV